MLVLAEGGDLLGDHDQEDDAVVHDALERGAGGDLPEADAPRGADVVDEVGTHGGAELVHEAGVAERQDPGDVVLDPPEVEGGDGDRELLDEVEAGGRGVGKFVRPGDESDGLDGDDAGEDDDHRGGGEGVADEAGDHRGTVTRRVLVLWTIAGVLAVVAGVLGVLLLRQPPGEIERRDEVVAVSERFVLALTSYDHTALDEQRDAVLGLATGSFADDYAETFGAEELRTALVETESVAQGEVAVGPLLATLEDTRARTFTVVEQTVSSSEVEGPQTRRLRVELTLVDTPDGWRVDAVAVT